MRFGAERFLTLAAQVFACVIGIVVMLLPRRPTSMSGWLAYLGALALLVAVFFCLARILLLLGRRPHQGLVNRLFGVVVAIVPGVALVYLLYSHADVVMRHFQ